MIRGVVIGCPSYSRILLKCAIGILIIVCAGCATNHVERDFFELGYDGAGSRFESYSLEDQIKIYFYGMQTISPPMTVLSRPIAERGSVAITPLMAELKLHPTDQNIRDAMMIFETMQRIGSYNVQLDKALMKKLNEYVSGMANGIWKAYSKNQMAKIKAYKGYESLQH